MNVRTLTHALFLLFVPLAVATSASTAHALSCDGHLVEIGDSEAYVRSVCGAPTSETTRIEPRSAVVAYGYPRAFYGYGAVAQVQIDVLVYDFGPTRFIDELVFESGVLREDRVAGYGTREGARARREARRGARWARDDDAR